MQSPYSPNIADVHPRHTAKRTTMMITKTLIAAVMATGLVPTNVATIDGNILMESCKKNASFFDNGYCLAYVSAVVNIMGTDHALCLKSNVSYGQYVRVLRKFMDAHPELLHQEAHIVVGASLIDAFSCTK